MTQLHNAKRPGVDIWFFRPLHSVGLYMFLYSMSIHCGPLVFYGFKKTKKLNFTQIIVLWFFKYMYYKYNVGLY